MLDGPGSPKNSSKLNKFLHSEVNLLIKHIIVQDQDGQNSNIVSLAVYRQATTSKLYLGTRRRRGRRAGGNVSINQLIGVIYGGNSVKTILLNKEISHW